MLRRRLPGVLISDIKYIARMPWLLAGILFPIFVILLHFFALKYISVTKDAERAYQYYTVTVVSLISAIPFIYGIVFSFRNTHGIRSGDNKTSVQPESEKRDLFLIRLLISGLWALIVVLPVTYITDAVATEGWLRGIYVSILLATTAPFIFAFSSGSGGSISGWRVRSLISVLFVLPVPFGLILHHPWNYLAFFSPFYWINWAWIIPSPGESLIYGLIAIAIITSVLSIYCWKYMKPEATV
jgi:hypothetical protein